ncbi:MULTISPECIES: helix-turn-helix domain-containing protein [Roseobacteraceae]|uniref:helix-turn-helix domain-containing protein n=1 Tax=Roseobacteraceae TaxID=2854170 RepID=UPI002B26535D|nr:MULTISPECIES: helix-turn-helix domain-containing protein [Roseobacteraceae]
MNSTKVTTFSVAAQETCALSGPRPFHGMGTIDAQPGFQPIRRRDLMAAVNTLGRDLGLRPASIVVLDALLSCLPCKGPDGRDQPITPAILLTVFASNDTLCYRAKGITDRQLRRHLERLEEVGLLRRRDSANGKRFPIYRGGRVVGAFGLDLSPLLQQSRELLARAQLRRDEAAELRGLKAHIQQLRSECLRIALDAAARDFVESTRNLMRRAGASVAQAKAILMRLARMLSDAGKDTPCADAAQTADVTLAKTLGSTVDSRETPATDGRNVRHKEPVKPYTKKSFANQIDDWSQLSTVPKFFPEKPTSEHGFHDVIYGFGKMLGIPHNALARAIAVLGSAKTLLLQDRIARDIVKIANPDQYFAMALRREQPRVGHGQLSGRS